MHTLPIGPQSPWLAPLAGYSDLPFRLLCREYGAACAVTEMVSAKGLVYGNASTAELLATCPEDSPLVVQLFGADPDMMAQAMDTLLARGFAFFDLNCGCSVPKVVKTGAGASLLRQPELLETLARIMIERAGPGRVGFKLRLGWGPQDLCVFPLAEMLEKLGAAWLTLHPRHARQGYSGTAAWEHLAALKRASAVPVIASGDLFCAADARRCLEQTGVDGVMFARGALYDPSIFKWYLNNDHPAPSGPEIASLLLRHAQLIRTHGKPEKSLLRMRSIVPRYVRGLLGARTLRQEAALCTSWEHLEAIAERIAQARPAPHLDTAPAKEDFNGRA